MGGQRLVGGTGAYKIGTVTVRTDAAEATVSPFYLFGEGAFDVERGLVVEIPTTFVEANLAVVPEPTAAVVFGLGFLVIGIGARRARSFAD